MKMIDFVYQLLAKIGYTHPIHPTEVHMPIGLVVGALIFALTGAVFRREKLVLTPRHCIILAFIWIFPTMLLGLMDWRYFYGGAWLLPIKIKLVVAPLLTVLLFVAIILARKYGATSKRVLPAYFLCFCCVVVLGYFGGQLVYGGKTRPSPEQFKAGEKIFTVNCSTCHPHGGNVIDASKPVMQSPKLQTFDDFVAWVRHAEPPMPSFSSSKLSETELKEVYEYIMKVLEYPKKE
jgi:uncharacterized membrane protein